MNSLVAKSILYVRRDFVDAATASAWCAAAREGASLAATVANAQGNSVIDERARRTLQVSVPPDTRDALRARLEAVRAGLLAHFGMPLGPVQSPQFLRYRRGDFFRAHQDTSKHQEHGRDIQARRVSAVLFLNAHTALPEPGSYCGGELVLYQPRDPLTPRLPIRGEPGLLVAFPSDAYHEVRPVTHGERLTAVAWYCAPDESE
jgi:SM-20-related protein